MSEILGHPAFYSGWGSAAAAAEALAPIFDARDVDANCRPGDDESKLEGPSDGRYRRDAHDGISPVI